jgi:outer membrane protein assembly factor BamA
MNQDFTLHKLSIAILILVLLPSFFSLSAIERRKDQSPKEFEYVVLPYAMKMPGIGSWIGVGGGVSNMFETEADFYFATMNGDLDGYVTGVVDFPTFYEPLTFNIFRNYFTKASIQIYDRGVDSDPEEYRYVSADKIQYDVYMVNLQYWEKRIHIYSSIGTGKVRLDELKDKDGDKIADIDKGEETSETTDYGVMFDYTDDRQDPRTGVRVEVRRAESPRESNFDPDFYRMDYNLAYYLPLGKINTWVFNYFRSDAIVTDKGETDPDMIRVRTGIDCSYTPNTQTQCEADLEKQVADTLAHNTYGTASPLGGVMNMRSYPQGRFSAAHSLFYGTEFRWNLTEEFTPFDIFLAKGVRTGLQVAFFAEHATLADKTSELGDQWKDSYGVGVRLVLAGGFVFRLDLATGDEGFQSQLFMNYPWGLFM